MSKTAPHRFQFKAWRLINLILLVIGFLIPVVHDRAFGIISFLNILAAMLLFLPGVMFQALTTPGKVPGLLIYLGGLISLISLIIYVIVSSLKVWSRNKSKKKSLRSLLLITMSGIGVTIALFLWQGHLTYGAGVMVAALISCFALEIVELQSIQPRR